MKRPTPIFWMSFGLVCLTLGILLLSDLTVGLIPDPSEQIIAYRQKYSEALAVQYSLLAHDEDKQFIQKALNLLVQRNDDIESAALVLENGEMSAFAGPHHDIWAQPNGTQSTIDHIQIPIFNADRHWGTLQLRFRSMDENGWTHMLNSPWVRFLGVVMAYGLLGYFVFIKRTLRQLDPSSVVPMRVKAAFDVLAEGVVFLDTEGRIVLANQAFSRIVDVDPPNLMGSSLGSFAWTMPVPIGPIIIYPWNAAQDDQEVKLDVPIILDRSGEVVKRFRVNCTPIFGESQQIRGILVSFNDVTELDDTIRQLEVSKLELEQLAHKDPLTGCCNRRALFEAIEDQWEIAHREGSDLVCLMADIDHFKSYNDRFGHAVGDQVIQVVATVLSTTLRPLDIIGRYGGEEFCIILPGQTSKEGVLVAERLRKKIENLASNAIRTTSGQKITMSVGVAALAFGASDPLELVNQADQALYAAKKAGRNRVGQWTQDGPVVAPREHLDLVCTQVS